MYAEPLGLYVVADVEGDVVRSLEMTRDRPGSRPRNTPFIDALKRYFETGRGDFSGFRPDLSGVPPFQKKALQALCEVPAGKTVTYGELAAIAGSPGAARAVGNAMAHNPVPLLVPCHRVVAANGLGGFTGGLWVKRALLELESTEGTKGTKGTKDVY